MSRADRRPDYMRKLERLLREAPPRPGCIGVGYVQHADSCPYPRDPAAGCRCEPEVLVAWVEMGAA